MSEKLLSHSRATDDLRALAHYYTATIALSEKDHDRAIAGYNAVIRINSADLAAESRYSIASIYATKGQNDLAEKLAEESARANVGYPFWVAKSLLLLSSIKYEKGDLLNAKAILEAILENFSEDATIVGEANALLNKVTTEEKNQSRLKENTGNSLELQDPPKKDN
jgi:tetratricopeptide (TPR) repeat protein